MATIMYYPSRNPKKERRITVMPNNWIGIFRPQDVIWLKETLMPLNATFRFTIIKSRCVVDFPSDDAMNKFMVAYRVKNSGSAK